LNYIWKIDGEGSFVDGEGRDAKKKTGTKQPVYKPEKVSALVKLHLMAREEPELCKTTKALVVFKDHLERDVNNFLMGNSCGDTIAGVAKGLQRPDGGYMDDPDTQRLGCGDALSHAQSGAKDGARYEQLRDQGWQEVATPTGDYLTWTDFTTITVDGVARNRVLRRGWKLWLQRGTELVRHFMTVKEDGNAAGVTTYAADATSKKFRHEKVEDYYKFVLKMDEDHGYTEDTRRANIRVKILVPPGVQPNQHD